MKTVTKTFIWILLSLSLLLNVANSAAIYQNRQIVGEMYAAVAQSFQGVKVDMQFIYSEMMKMKEKLNI